MPKPVSPSDSLLAALPPELSQGLFAETSKVRLAADQTLFFAGDEGDGCYRLDEGMLKASVIDPGGGVGSRAKFSRLAQAPGQADTGWI